MKVLLWVIVTLVVIFGGYAIYESQSASTATPVTTATTTATTTANLPEIIPGTPSVMYSDPQFGFSIYYPSTTVLETTGFDGFLPLTQTPVIGLKLSPDLYQGTNLTEAGVYIGATTTPSIVSACMSPSASSGETEASSTAAIGAAQFAVFDSTGVGAGNIYQEKAFRTVQSGTCFEIVELLHSGQIANYPSGSVTAFDETKFSGILDAMVNTFAFKKVQ
jgi:hypothetical protein